MRVSHTSCVLLVLLALLADGEVHAQWTNVAPSLIPGTTYGALHYKDGILWAGHSYLFSSTDKGITWTLNNFNEGTILDIQFYNTSTGLVSTQSGLYITNDGGASWNRLGGISNCRSVAFGGSPLVLYALQDSPPMLYRSFDGGMNWAQTNFNSSEAMSLVIAKDQTLYVFLYFYGSKGMITFSTDNGTTWNQKNGIADGDSYSMAADSCNPQRLYIANEEVAQSGNGVADLYTSSDAGDSWQSMFSRPIKYLVGSITATSNTLYAGGSEGNLIRSTDHGRSWKELPAPTQDFDNHNIACVDDNTLYLIAKDGSIWMTTTSAGDSLTSFPANGSLSLSADTLFIHDTLNCNVSSISEQILLTRRGCAPPWISNWKIIGPDSLNYTAGNLTVGSFDVTYQSKTPVNSKASLIVTLSDGTKDTIILRGSNTARPFTYLTTPQNLFTIDSTYLCSTKTEKLYLTTGGCLPKILSQKISGAASGEYQILKQIATPLTSSDSIIISFSPTTSGTRDAVYELTFDNGTKISIPLQGFGIAPQQLALATKDVSTDTIGGTVYIPISINGLEGIEDITIILHYSDKLIYRGSYTQNICIDVPNQNWTGRSQLHISGATSGKILGFARFDVFNDSLMPKFLVTFDSVRVLSEKAPCEYQYLPVASITSTVTPIKSECGYQTLTRFMLDSAMPQFALSPNPSTGDVSIVSSRDLGEVTITIYDLLGSKRYENTVSIQKNIPLKIPMALGSGVYNLRIMNNQFVRDLRVLVKR